MNQNRLLVNQEHMFIKNILALASVVQLVECCPKYQRSQV